MTHSHLAEVVTAAILGTVPGAIADHTTVSVEHAYLAAGQPSLDTWTGGVESLADRIVTALHGELGKDTREPGESTPALGEFLACGNPRCDRGEWAAKAAERGWEEKQGGRWLCAQCAADRADFLSMADGTRQEILHEHIVAAGGRWSTSRVLQTYRPLGIRVTRYAARSDLAELHRQGHLTLHDQDPNRRFYTAAGGSDA
ncbi:hypothetical protein ACWF94_26065 [Streptomyces sp. NPDC055078]